MYTAWKVSVCRVFPVRIFRHSGLIWKSLRIKSECGKIGTRKTANTDTFHAVVTRMCTPVNKNQILFHFW